MTAAQATSKPRVAVVMGSDSDFECMATCIEQLNALGIISSVQVLSAHRTPDAVHALAKGAVDAGIEVIIAAAGMSAALAGVIAANTTLPVIGVPMASGALAGIDALLSTVQMPPGIPVATVGIGSVGAGNAALLAAQILALNDAQLAEKLRAYKQALAQKVHQKNEQLQQRLAAK